MNNPTPLSGMPMRSAMDFGELSRTAERGTPFPAPGGEAILQVERLGKTYMLGQAAIPVLRDVSLAVRAGEVISIIGASGSGKSTLLHILGALDQPSGGTVRFQGRDLYALSAAQRTVVRGKHIGFVFQFYHLLPEFTVLENVLMPVLINAGSGRKGPELKQGALELLERVGLGERATHFPSQLSGGEQQRVAIVRALINQPSLLLCDEPTGNLDSKTGEGIISLVKKINLERRMSVVLVTHNLELAKAADKSYHLKDGVLVN